MVSRSPREDLLIQLSALTQIGVAGNLSDAQLLDQFIAGGEAAESAFGALVARHGPMVLDVCLNVLRDPHDAQDAFQATFLVLASRAGSIRQREALAGWLYRVAHRVAARSRANVIRRRIYEERAAAMLPAREEARARSWPDLHEAIARLPAKYREPVVLCYLEGLSTEATASRLGCPHGTVLSRLSRARERLRRRLIGRGSAWTAVLLVPGTRLQAPAAVPSDLLKATARAALRLIDGSAANTMTASTEAVFLARKVVATMMISKLKVLGATVLACALTMGGIRTFAWQNARPGAIGAAAVAQSSGSDPAKDLMRSVDKLQAGLEESTRRNAQLSEELRHIRANLEALRAAASKTAHTPAQAAGQLAEVLKRHPLRHITTEEEVLLRHQLYMTDLVAGGTSLIVDEPIPGFNWCGTPSWSHDGRRIAFDASPGRDFQGTHLIMMELGDGRPTFKDLGPGNCPTLSPDDEQIAFLVNPGAVEGAQDGIYLMRADGSERRRVAPYGVPYWSPDGQEIMIRAFTKPTVITLYNLGTGKVSTVTVAGYRLFSWPLWAGPGRLVAVIGHGDEGEAVTLLDVSEPAEAKIVEVLWKRNPDLDVEPSWPLYWPQAGRCFFVGLEPNKRTLYSVKRGEPSRVARMEAEGRNDELGNLALSPDGRFLLFGANRPERR
jgi:RNA polymerase sigma factor (sigma-70 family)